MSKTKTAIVILNWNGQKFLDKFLPSVVQHSSIEGVEIVVADNGSTDNSMAFLSASYPKITQIQLDKNYGFAEGYNKALNQIDATYFVLLNSDVEVTENWIQPIIELLDSDATIGACAPKIKSFANKESFEYAGAAGGFIDKYGYPFCRGRILSEIETDNNQYNFTKEVFWATGACMFVRADLYKELGGLDGDFFAHMEEIDFCWRLKNRGFKVMYFGDVTVYHVGGGTLPNNNPHKLYLNYRNNLFLLYKNLPSNKLFTTIFTRMILDGMSSNFYLLQFQFAFFFAVFKAHISFYSSLSTFRKKRKTLLEANNKTKIHKEIYNKSIVFSFFLKKKRNFNDLNFYF